MDSLPYYIVVFSWNECKKSFLILLRNVLFQEQKAQIMLLENRVESTAVAKLEKSTHLILSEAVQELKDFFPAELKSIKNSKGGGIKQLEKWALEDNPQQVYHHQFNQITIQCYNLVEQYLQMANLSNQLTGLHSIIEETINSCQKDILQIEKTTDDTIQFISVNSKENIGKISSRLEDLEEAIIFPDYNRSFKSDLEKQLENIQQKANFVVAEQEGLLQRKELNCQKSIRQWLDAEVLPLLYEIWELSINGTNGLKMTLVNVRNRAILLTTEAKSKGKIEIVPSDLYHPLESFLSKIEDTKKGLKELEAVLHLRLNEHFKISMIYKVDKEFLYVPLQKTLNQFTLKENKWVQEAQELISHQIGNIKAFRSSVELRENQSLSERVVDFIKDHSLDESNSQYSSIFLTKGHIGESFWVGRQKEMDRMNNLILDWEKGFRGAVVLSGQRFSGKSFFGDAVASRFFKNSTIWLTPKSTINYQGRKFNTEYDLGESLEFIQNSSTNDRPLIWIDDLELWSSPENPIGANVRQLCQFVDRHYDKAFTLVSMGNWTKSRLDKSHQLDRSINANINLDEMKIGDVLEAIVIRHGATHKTLIDANDKEVDPKSFRKMVSDIFKRHEGNIGAALQEWVVRMTMTEGDNVRYQTSSSADLPDFFSSDAALVASTILLEKRTNEYRLRKMFGPSFKEKYAFILQRLISTGVLKRNRDGWLEFEDAVVNEIGKILQKRNYISFYKKGNN